MERILRNLVSNAVRHTQRAVSSSAAGGEAGISPSRCGIPARAFPWTEQERVFQEYYQLGNPERDRTRGLGLGLAIVRRLTHLLDCRLTLRSEPGRGSCFEVTIPLAAGPEDAEEPLTQDGAGVWRPGSWSSSMTSSPYAKPCRACWRAGGMRSSRPVPVTTRCELLSTCPVRPDMIISDYRLRGGETGTDVIERLRSEYNETIPAMLITGDTAPARLVEAQASGLLLLHKPVSNSRLRAAIVNLGGAAGARHSGDTDALRSVLRPGPNGRRLRSIHDIQRLEDRRECAFTVFSDRSSSSAMVLFG